MKTCHFNIYIKSNQRQLGSAQIFEMSLHNNEHYTHIILSIKGGIAHCEYGLVSSFGNSQLGIIRHMSFAEIMSSFFFSIIFTPFVWN